MVNGIPAAVRICCRRSEVDARISTLTLYRRTAWQEWGRRFRLPTDFLTDSKPRLRESLLWGGVE
jgi:hypothetical protein